MHVNWSQKFFCLLICGLQISLLQACEEKIPSQFPSFKTDAKTLQNESYTVASLLTNLLHDKHEIESPVDFKLSNIQYSWVDNDPENDPEKYFRLEQSKSNLLKDKK